MLWRQTVMDISVWVPNAKTQLQYVDLEKSKVKEELKILGRCKQMKAEVVVYY